MAKRDQKGMQSNRELTFEVDAGLLFQLGEHLVARASVALAELIKNAYDADATQVTVRFEGVSEPGGTIVVEDNGTGMSLEDVRRTWMRIATGEKESKRVSPVFGRPRTGHKGIGRFACRRLSGELVLETVARLNQRSHERTTVTFDWSAFRRGERLEDIGSRFETKSASKDAPTGTTLRMHGAYDEWKERDIAEVRKDIMGLVSPLSVKEPAADGLAPYRADPDFQVHIEAPEFPDQAGEVGPEFLEAAWGILEGEVDDSGKAEYRLNVRDAGSHVFGPGERFRHLGEATFRIHFFVYVRRHLKDLAIGVKKAREIGREQGGVRIYLDRFRVFPYGDPREDWLYLDRDVARRVTTTPPVLEAVAGELARPMLLLPRNMQLFGKVFLSRGANPGINLNVSRERLVENLAFEDLRQFVRLGIDWMTVQYARETAEERQRRREESPEAKVVKALDAVREAIEAAGNTIQPETRTRIVQALAHLEGAIKTEQEQRMSEFAMLRVLATTGTMLAVLEHTLRLLVDEPTNILRELTDLRPQLSGQARKESDLLVERVTEYADTVEQHASMLGYLYAPESRQRRRRLVVREEVDRLGHWFGSYLQEYGIQFSNAVPDSLLTPPMYPAELHIILLNIFTNALKAVSDQPPLRRIKVTGEESAGHLQIAMLDSGLGVEPDLREEVFKAFFTTSSPDTELGVGTGLGLKIVADIVEACGGKARFTDPEAPWKTRVEITLPVQR